MTIIEEVPPALAYCEFECPLAVCRADCPRKDAQNVFFTREPEAFNFQSRTPATANVSHRALPDWALELVLALGTIIGLGFIVLAVIIF
jgi:hypothetical protein